MIKKIISAKKNIGLLIEDKINNASELLLANKELALQVVEREKRAAELVIANIELAYQNEEKEKRAAELVIANKELALQLTEKEKRAAELVVANTELAFQNQEKENRAAELIIANKELAYQNNEKEKRAAELIIANKELAYQNNEKEQRAAELVIANKELAYQNNEKENRAAELIIANKELAFQVIEKENRAAELVIANKELAYQNHEKENRAAELLILNKELESFNFISSHDLQEPLRKIQSFTSRILSTEYDNLSEKGKYYVERTNVSAQHMQTLINDLLAYSRTTPNKRNFENKNLHKIVMESIASLKEEIEEKQAVVEVNVNSNVSIIPFQFKQLIQNLIGNSLKFCDQNVKPHIKIESNFVKHTTVDAKKSLLKSDHHHIRFSDNGIGFDPQFKDKIFEIFQRLHQKSHYEGTGIGLTIVKKIVNNHNGIITANCKPNEGAVFDIYIPAQQSI
ncbi:ATP-binding protein [Flavobacterium sp.]|uniref:sensor histidine kinase n=1 Tax=Flavobacterium sp. TaxID=239 RepID=UPI0024886F48|nr:ATP-binding protein [Flavobacterium sp.]MDI1318049.1 ATP-binding protein [Flavobacterium sp.]